MTTATITRKFVDWSYPRNGNTHNPTPKFRWEVEVDGKTVTSADRTLASAKLFAKVYFGATAINIVREPLPRNPWSHGGTA